MDYARSFRDKLLKQGIQVGIFLASIDGKKIYKILLVIAALALVSVLILWISGQIKLIGPLLIAGLTTGAIGLRGHSFFKGFSFTVLIFAAVAASLFYPGAFSWGLPSPL